MKQLIKDYFTFNRKERNGIFILSLIILSLLYFDKLARIIIPAGQIDHSGFSSEVSGFIRQREIFNDSVESARSKKMALLSSVSEYEEHGELFFFNPNTISSEQWIKLGLSPKQSSIIENYLSKGGKFHKKEDLKKIYGINEETYLKLEPYIRIGHENKKNNILNSWTPGNNHSGIVNKGKELMIELNTADSVALTGLKGIGPFYSSRIIKYRDKLGGFIHVNQLTEVAGVTEELAISIRPNIKIDTSIVRKININTCKAEDLKQHPYINNWNIANSIVNYRTKHGPYKSAEEIINSDLVTETLYLRLAAYLIVEE